MRQWEYGPNLSYQEKQTEIYGRRKRILHKEKVIDHFKDWSNYINFKDDQPRQLTSWKSTPKLK